MPAEKPSIYLAIAFSAWRRDWKLVRQTSSDLDGLEQCFDHDIVVAIALAAHRRDKAVLIEHPSVII
jgi:hypothetical protein